MSSLPTPRLTLLEALGRIDADLRRGGRTLLPTAVVDSVRAELASHRIAMSFAERAGTLQTPVRMSKALRATLHRLEALLAGRHAELCWGFLPHGASVENSPDGREWCDLRDECLRRIDLAAADLKCQVEVEGGSETYAAVVLRRLFAERRKLERGEFRIVFTGAMKAGKTTTINAVVGMELLPARSEPMTTMPTIVRHVPGCLVPRLRIAAAPELNALLRDLATGADVDSLQLLSGARTTLEEIRAGRAMLEVEVAGLDAVRAAQALLHDTLRIADAHGLGDRVRGIFEHPESLPVVEVAFANLDGVTNPASSGRGLALVDTPGPDEAGRSKVLREIVMRQMDAASAIVVVANYTLLGGNADVAATELAREFVEGRDADANMLLLNRYDQADSQSPPPHELIASLAATHPEFRHDRIFPISASKALMSRRILRDLDGGVPLSVALKTDVSAQVAGAGARHFAAQADTAAWREAAEELWAGGRFDESHSTWSGLEDPRADNRRKSFVDCLRAAAGEAPRRVLASALAAHSEALGISAAPRSAFEDARHTALARHVGYLEGAATDIERATKALEEFVSERIALLVDAVAEAKARATTEAMEELEGACGRVKVLRRPSGEEQTGRWLDRAFTWVKGLVSGTASQAAPAPVDPAIRTCRAHVFDSMVAAEAMQEELVSAVAARFIACANDLLRRFDDLIRASGGEAEWLAIGIFGAPPAQPLGKFAVGVAAERIVGRAIDGGRCVPLPRGTGFSLLHDDLTAWVQRSVECFGEAIDDAFGSSRVLELRTAAGQAGRAFFAVCEQRRRGESEATYDHRMGERDREALRATVGGLHAQVAALLPKKRRRASRTGP